MTFAIVGGGQLDTGYTIDNSLRFNDDDSAFLSRTPGTAGDRKTYTISTWVKRSLLTSQIQPFLECYLNANQWTSVSFGTDNKIQFYHVDSGTDYGYKTDMVFRDVSAWYHIVIALDTTQATAANRMILYVNGNETTFDQNFGEFPQNDNTWINSTNGHNIGKYSDQSKYFDGYMAEYHFIDGQQLTASDFGEFDADSGIWKPKAYEGTYGTNGFYLDFEDSGSLGADQSGNGNNFTPTNLVSTDQVLDSPTNNFATLNELTTGTYPELREGNLQQYNHDTADSSGVASTFMPKTGKWYCELFLESPSAGDYPFFGITDQSQLNQKGTHGTKMAAGFEIDGVTNNQGSTNLGSITNTNTGWPTFADNDIVMFALDCDNRKWWIGRNGTWTNSGDPAAGTNEQLSWTNTTEVCSFMLGYSGGGGGGDQSVWNFGQEGSFAGKTTAQGNADENGFGDFYYTPPSGYLALCTQNLATALTIPIDNSGEYFNTLLWTGNGSNPRSLTGVGFQPDWLWTKARSSAFGHNVYDSSRGNDGTAYYRLETQDTASEIAQPPAGHVTSLDSDGFSVTNGSSSDNIVNNSGTTYVGWNWKVNAGTTSSNTDGGLTSTVQVNSDAGISIGTYTGTGSDTDIGTGLSRVDMAIVKNRDSSTNWQVGFSDVFTTSGTRYLTLNTDAAAKTVGPNPGEMQQGAVNMFPIATRADLGIFEANSGGGGFNDVCASGEDYVFYAFKSVEGFSKIGKYVGNGSTNGTFVYTGFRPAFVLWKRTDGATDWRILDTTRDSFNVADKRLFPNNTDAENTVQDTLDFLSNGFKHRATNSGGNASGGNYIYMAFAENPFVTSTGVPVVAR